jgi:hypothetical protein
MITDRIIAKTAFRVLGGVGASLVLAGVPITQVAAILDAASEKAWNGSTEIRDAYNAMLKEVTEEAEAELAGRAEPRRFDAPGVSRHENWD